MTGSLTPQVPWKATAVQKSTDFLEDRAIETLCNTVVLRSVMDGELLPDPLLI